jgi:hypothetical protein
VLKLARKIDNNQQSGWPIQQSVSSRQQKVLMANGSMIRCRLISRSVFECAGEIFDGQYVDGRASVRFGEVFGSSKRNNR